MAYRVRLADPAKLDADHIYEWVVERSPLHGPEWFNGLLQALGSLSENPQRCPLAPESRELGEDIRQLIYGKRRGRYRILYRIRGDEVEVLHIRHGAQEELRRRL